MFNKTTFALGKDKKVALWCDGTPARFTVLNGHWDGSFADGKVFVKGTKTYYPAELLWTGVVPSPQNSNYNEAINWIQEQL